MDGSAAALHLLIIETQMGTTKMTATERAILEQAQRNVDDARAAGRVANLTAEVFRLQEPAEHLAEVRATLSGIADVPNARGDGSSSNLLGWDRRVSENFAPGWLVGSDGDDGQHLPDATGWPYSVFRKNVDVGGCDVVLCHGIQDLRDAQALAAILNGRK